jgi:translation elongation factor EF-Ts
VVLLTCMKKACWISKKCGGTKIKPMPTATPLSGARRSRRAKNGCPTQRTLGYAGSVASAELGTEPDFVSKPQKVTQTVERIPAGYWKEQNGRQEGKTRSSTMPGRTGLPSWKNAPEESAQSATVIRKQTVMPPLCG